VDLPPPLGPRRAEDFALANLEAYARERFPAAVNMREIFDLDHSPGLSMSINP